MSIQALGSIKTVEGGLKPALKRGIVSINKTSLAENGAHRANKLAFMDEVPEYDDNHGWIDTYEAAQKCEERREKWNNFKQAFKDLFS